MGQRIGKRQFKPAIFRGICSVCGKAITNRNPGVHKINCQGKEGVKKRMRENNPMHDPEARQKATAQIKNLIKKGKFQPYGRGKAGNGCPPTKEEKEAFEALKDLGFLLRHRIPSGKGSRKLGLASSYELDLANLEKKIAIELDGNSHKGREVLDAKKDNLLRSKGWRVIRVKHDRKMAIFDPYKLREKVLALWSE